MSYFNRVLMRIAMFVFLIFLISGFKSCTELKYSLSAKDSTGRVNEIREKTNDNGHMGWTIAYSFHNDDANELQKGYSLVTDEAVGKFTEGQEIPIEYCGTSQLDSRIKGESNKNWVYAFLGSMAFCVGAVAILSWQSMREEKRGRRR